MTERKRHDSPRGAWGNQRVQRLARLVRDVGVAMDGVRAGGDEIRRRTVGGDGTQLGGERRAGAPPLYYERVSAGNRPLCGHTQPLTIWLENGPIEFFMTCTLREGHPEWHQHIQGDECLLVWPGDRPPEARLSTQRSTGPYEALNEAFDD